MADINALRDIVLQMFDKWLLNEVIKHGRKVIENLNGLAKIYHEALRGRAGTMTSGLELPDSGFDFYDVFIKHATSEFGMKVQKQLSDHMIKQGYKDTKNAIKQITQGELWPTVRSSDSGPEDIKRRPTPLLNLPAGQQSMSNVEEVAVVPPPRKIAKSHPDYFSINLPFYANERIYLTSTVDTDQIDIRLNSIWDPLANGAAGRDTHQPLGRDTWAGIYDYYRVLSCDINLTFNYINGVFGDGTTSSTTDVPRHVLVGYCLVDDAAATPQNAISFVEMKHTKTDVLYPQFVESTKLDGSTQPEPTTILAMGGAKSMSFHYNPGGWDLHVSRTGDEERWTPIASNPTDTRFLSVMCAYPSNTTKLATGNFINMQVDIHISYTVQFREISTAKKRTIDTTQ